MHARGLEDEIRETRERVEVLNRNVAAERIEALLRCAPLPALARALNAMFGAENGWNDARC